MNRRKSPADRAWRALVARAREAPESASPEVKLSPSPEFVERVLATLPNRRVELRRERVERAVAWIAGGAMAASLLLAAWNWNSVASAWASEPVVFDQRLFDMVVGPE